MINKRITLIKKDIDRLRLELDTLVENCGPGLESVRKVSCELDEMILSFYNAQQDGKGSIVRKPLRKSCL